MTNSPARSDRGSERIAARPATVLIRDFLDVNAEFEKHVGRELAVNATDRQAMEHLIMTGPLSPTQLARRLSITTAAVTSVVDRLVALGHVNRHDHPTDRRAVVVVANPASVRRAMGTIMPMIAGIDAVLDEFDADEQRVIATYLQRVLDSYRTHIPEAGPDATPEDARVDSSL